MLISRKQQLAVRALNYDLFENAQIAVSKQEISPKEQPGSLPSTETLQHLFSRFNFLYFNGKLTRPAIEYSDRMTCAGSYTPVKNLIKISRKYHAIFPQEIEDTLKHEMIHIIHFNHNVAFKAEAERIGASLKAKTHQSLRRQTKYLYVCPSCGLEYPRQKKVRMSSCGSCSRKGRFDPDFKLKLSKSFTAGREISYA
ncbi:MAG: SprT-like domain-containing protein [candidate division Zixibacteria bacterium]|nr:SprT-like domain-containing protein [candidate division Zixibacteria bacterium]